MTIYQKIRKRDGKSKSSEEVYQGLKTQERQGFINFDTFFSDLRGVYDGLSKVNDWQDADTMTEYGSSVSSMLGRARAYRDYYTEKDEGYDATEIDRVIGELSKMHDFVTEKSQVYSGYASAEDYNAAVKRYADDFAAYGGKSSEELKNFIKYPIMSAEIDEQIAALKGFIDENRNYLGQGKKPSAAFMERFGLTEADLDNIYMISDAYREKTRDIERVLNEEIRALEKQKSPQVDAAMQYYYYQALMEELGAHGYRSNKTLEEIEALRGDASVGAEAGAYDSLATAEDAESIAALYREMGALGESWAGAAMELTDEERSLYEYLRDNVGAKEATDYYRYLYNTNSDYLTSLTARAGKTESEKKSTFEKLMGSVGTGFDNWLMGNARALASLTGETFGATAGEYESMYTRESFSDSKVAQGAYDIGVAFGNMAPSILASYLTKGLLGGKTGAVASLAGVGTSVATFGVSIYGNAYHEAVQQGYDKSQAMTYGVLTAASEVALQNLIGGIPGVGKHLSGEFLSTVANRTSNVLLRVAAQIGGDALGEFTEEYLQEVLGQVFRNVALGENGEIKLFSEEALYSGIIGAFMSLGMNVPGSAVNMAGLRSSGKLYNVGSSMTADGVEKTGVAALIEEGLAADPESEAYRYAEMLSKRQESGKKISNVQVGMLAQLIKEAAREGQSAAATSFNRSRAPEIGDKHFTFDNSGEKKDIRVSQGLVNFANQVLSMQDKTKLGKRKYKLGQVSDGHAAIIKKTTGLDIAGYEIWVDGSAIQHIEERHGANGRADHSMADRSDIGKILYVVNNADGGALLRNADGSLDVDSLHKNSDNTPAVKVFLYKRDRDGMYMVTECIPDNEKKRLHVKSAYKNSGNGQVLRVQAQSSPQLTSKTLHDYLAANNSIPYSDEYVKQDFENNYSKYKGDIDKLWSAALVVDPGATMESESAMTNSVESENKRSQTAESEAEIEDAHGGYRADMEAVAKAEKGLSGESSMLAQYEKFNADVEARGRQNAAVYVADYSLVRDLAAGGRSAESIRGILESGNGVGQSLNDVQFLAAYQEGRALYEKQSEGRPKPDRSHPRRVGKVYYNGAQAVRTKNGVLSLPASGISKRSRLNADQRSVVDFAEKVLAPMGVNVVFYSSKNNRTLPNGLYDGNAIYIDIEAGMSERASETFVGYALAHELTHMAERLSPELWQRYADAVLSVLSREEGVSVTRLIADKRNEYEQARIATLRKTYPEKSGTELRDMVEPLTDDGAIREIVAEASQLIFTRESRFAEKLAEKDATLWDKIKQLVMDAIKKLQAVIRGIPQDGISEHLVGHLEELAESFDEMMADALYQAGYGTAEESDFFAGAMEEKPQTDGDVQFQYLRTAKDGRRIYVSDFGSEVSPDDRVKLFKKRIATIFNLGMVVLKTDTKKIQIRGDKFTAQKNLYGDEEARSEEIKAKVDALYDFADILQTSTYLPDKTNTEVSYSNPKITPKNAAHKGVKYWYKFQNKIILDGIPYAVIFNIRDKGKEQYQYLIEFQQENKAFENSNTVKKDLLRTNQTPYGNSIPQKSDLSTEKTEIPENSEMTDDSDFDDTQEQYRRVYATTSDRQILAKAVDNIVQSDADYEIARKYKEKLASYREMQSEIDFLTAEINDLFAVDRGDWDVRDRERLDVAMNRRQVLREELKKADSALLGMEALAPLRSLVSQERARANRAERRLERQKKKTKEALATQKERLETKRTESLEKQKEQLEAAQAEKKRKAQERALRVQYLARAERAISRLYRWTANPTKKEHVPTALLPYVKSLFEAVDVSHRFAQIERLEEQLAAVNDRIYELQYMRADASVIAAQEAYKIDLVERIKKLEGTQHNVTWTDRLDVLKNIISSVESEQNASQVYVDFAPGLAEDIQRRVDTFTDKFHVRLFDAKPEDIRFYAEALESITHSITEAGRLYANKRAAKVETLAEQSIEAFRHEKRDAARAQFLELPRRMYGLEALNPAYFGHKLGAGAEAVMDELYDGFYRVIANVRVIDEFADKLRRDYKVSEYTGKNQQIHRIRLKRGGSVSLTTGQLMTVLALSDRPQAQKHMFGRGIQSFRGNLQEALAKTRPLRERVADETKRLVGKGETDVSEFAKLLFGSIDVHRVTQADIDTMIGLLTSEQVACVKEIKRFLREDIAAMGNKTSQALYLYDMFTEENYFPIETVATFRAFSEKDKGLGEGSMDARSVFSVLNRGFTKQLQEQAGNPIVIRDIFDVFMEHCFDMANYAGLGPAVSDTIKWLSYRQKVVVSEAKSETSGNGEPHSTNIYTELRLKQNAKAVLNSEIVAALTGNEFQRVEGEKLSDRVIAFFDSIGNKAIHKELGEIVINKSSFRDDKAHGLTRNKIVSFMAVPQVIEKGHVIDVYQPEGKPYERIIIAAPITIGQQKYYVGVMVQRDHQTQRMYMHDIIAEEATLSFNTEPTTETGEGIRDKGHLFMTSILQNALSVKGDSENADNSHKSNVQSMDHFERDENGNDGTTLRDEMEKAWGRGAERYIRNLLMSLEGELKGTDGAKVINKLVRNAKIASVAGNARVVLQQPTAYVRAGAVISFKSLVNAWRFPGKGKEMRAEMLRYSELGWYKSLGFYDMNTSRSLLEKIKGNVSRVDQFREATTALAGEADMYTWGMIWRACRLETDAKIKAEGLKIEKNTDAYFAMVRDLFHKVINYTQVIDSPMHKNKLMSDPDSGMKQLTAFMAEPMLTLNMVQSAVDDVKRKRPEAKVKLGRVCAVYLAQMAAVGVMSALADAARDDDDDEGWLEKFGEAVLRNVTGVDLDDFSVGKIFAGDWNLFNNMPIIKEIFSLMEGYDASRMDLSGIEKMVAAATKLLALLSKEDKTGADYEKALYSLAQAISTVTGIPVSNLWRLVRSSVNTFQTYFSRNRRGA